MSNNLSYAPSDNKECKALPGIDGIDDSSETTQRLKMFNTLSGLTRAIGALLIILVVAWIGQFRGGFDSYGSQQFNWHPMLMILGMVFLYSNGMLIYRTYRCMAMQRLNVIHAGIMIFSALFTMIGLVIGFQKHNEAGGGYFPNMFSLHSWVGLTSAILFFFQCVAGLFSVFYPGIRPDLQATYKRWHVCLGTGGFVGAVIACILGFNEKAIFIAHNWGSDSENTIIWFIYLTLMAFGGLSVYLVSQDRFKRLARPGDDDPLTKEAVFGNLCSKDKVICCLPWARDDCARSFQIFFPPPNSNALETVDTHLPPAKTVP